MRHFVCVIVHQGEGFVAFCLIKMLRREEKGLKIEIERKEGDGII